MATWSYSKCYGQFILSIRLYHDIITNNGIYISEKIQEYLEKYSNTHDAFSWGEKTLRTPRFKGVRCIYIPNYCDRCDGIIGKASPGSLRQIARSRFSSSVLPFRRRVWSSRSGWRSHRFQSHGAIETVEWLMTAVLEGKSRDVPSSRSTRGERKEGERDESSFPVDPTIPRRLVPDFRTKRNERRTRGAAGTRGGCPRWKKKSRALLPAHERTKETIVEYEVEYKLSSGDRARNQSTSCPRVYPSTPLPFRSFPAYRLLYSKLYQTSRDVRMRSLCSGTKKLRRI